MIYQEDLNKKRKDQLQELKVGDMIETSLFNIQSWASTATLVQKDSNTS